MTHALKDQYTAIDWIDQIERYLARIDETRGPRCISLLPIEIEEIIELNFMRAIEAAMDLAIHIGIDRGYEDPRRRYPDYPVHREYRRLYFASLAEHGVIPRATAEALVDAARWFYFAMKEYWHVIPAREQKDLVSWLAALRGLVAAVAAHFSLVRPEDWEDSSGREPIPRVRSVVPTAGSGDGEDRGDVQVEG